MKNKIFTIIIGFLAFTLTTNAQQMGRAKKVWQPAQKIIKQNNHLATKSIILSEDFSGGSLPDGWQNIDNLSGGTWEFDNPGGEEFNSTTNANGFAIFDSDNYGFDNEAEDADLITKVINCSGNTNVTLSFEHYFKSGFEGSAEVFVSNDSGVSWTSIASWSATSTENAELAKYDISSIAAGKSNVMIKWKWKGDYSWYWAIDDIKVYEPEQNDLAISKITPSFVYADDDAIIKVTVKNEGILTQSDFSIKVVAKKNTSEVFSSTQNVTNAGLVAGNDSTYTISDIWTSIPAGTYTLSAYVELSSDTEPSNDTLIDTFKSVGFIYPEKGEIFGYDAYSTTDLNDHVVKIDINNGDITDITRSTTEDFLSCGDYIDGILTGVEFQSNNVYQIANDGGTYKSGQITGVTSVTGIAYDDSSNFTYVSDYNDTVSTLFSLSPTYSAHSIGVICDGLIIGIAGNGHGQLWGINMTDGNLYKINENTGVGTIVGSLGISISYGQDIGYDRGNNTLYGTLYDGTNGGLYSIDTTTGSATLIGSKFDDEITMCAIIPTEPKYTVTFNVTDGTNPIDSAEITILSNTIITDTTGSATIDLNNGDFTYTISKNGFGTINGMVSVKDTATTVKVSMVGLNTPNKFNLNIFPNPSNGSIIISLNGLYNVSVMNTIGQVITSKSINKRGTIDLSNQPAGIYFISVKSNNKITTKQIVIK